MSYYKIDKHIKSYIKKELYNYETNKNKIKEMRANIIEESGFNDGQPKGNETSDTTGRKTEKLLTTRALLIATGKVDKITRALEKLNEDDNELFRIIFTEGRSQVYAEMNYNISKDMYYDFIDKIVYLTAKEYGEI